MYARNDSETYHYIKKLRKIIDRFNEKYPGITVALNKTFLRIYLKFFIEKDSINDVFDNFMTNDLSLKNKIFKNKTQVNLEYSPKIEHTYSHKIMDTLALRRDKHRNMVELIYRNDTLHNTDSPEFRLLAFHGLSGYNKEMDIKEEKDNVFCFDFDTDDHKGSGRLYLPRSFVGEVGY
jgi:hypothetical protein